MEDCLSLWPPFVHVNAHVRVPGSSYLVAPAKQPTRLSTAGRRLCWIPAYAGMTNQAQTAVHEHVYVDVHGGQLTANT